MSLQVSAEQQQWLDSLPEKVRKDLTGGNTTTRYKAYIKLIQEASDKVQKADPEFKAWQAAVERYGPENAQDAPPMPAGVSQRLRDSVAVALGPMKADYEVAAADVSAQNKKSITGRIGSALKIAVPALVGGVALAGTGLFGAAAQSAVTGGVSAGEIAAAAGLPELGIAAQTGLGTAVVPAAVGAGATAVVPAAVGAGATAVVPAAVGAGATALAGLSGVELAKLGLTGIGALAGYTSSDKATDAANKATNAASQSAADASALGREELDFTKQQYADAKPYRDAAAKTAQEIAEAQLASQKQQDALAAEYAEYNRSTFRPLERGIVADATGYDTPEKRNAEAAAATANVDKRFAAVNDATARRLAASGIDPGSTRAMSVMDGQSIEQAKAGAGAAYVARKGVETTGFARKMDAASLGRNLPSNQATSAQLALTAGNSATGNAGAAVNAINSGVPQMQNAYNGAMQGASVSGGLYSSAAQLAQRAGVIDNAQLGALGDSLGNWANSQGGNAVLTKWFGS